MAEGESSGADADGDGDSGGNVPLDCEDGELDPGPNLVRRLTVDEYVSTVRALTGVEIEASARAAIPADVRADGFKNTVSGQISTLNHVEAYAELAEEVVADIADLQAFAAAYTDCTDFSVSCQEQFARNLGLAAFRAPVTEEELALLVMPFAEVEAEAEGFDVAAGLVLETVLQAPRFLFRMEAERGDGSIREVDGHELATRLSYLVWGAPPDTELLDAAAADTLATDAEIEAQVLRMLDDERVRESSLRFASDLAFLDRLDNLTRDAELFPDWDPALGLAMRDETRAFFEAVLWEDEAPVGELFSAQFTVVTPELGQHYGVMGAKAGERLDLSDIDERGGLLTQGAMLTIGGNEASMVSRGLFLLETFLCGHIQSPPPGIDTSVPDPEPGKSQRDYSQERVETGACGGCHAQMEPLVWGIERFLGDGSYALEDAFGNKLKQDGYLTIPSTGDQIEYASVAEMMAALADSQGVAECFADNTTQFAIGRKLADFDTCTVDAVRERFAASPGTYADLLVAIALSPGFRTIRTEE